MKTRRFLIAIVLVVILAALAAGTAQANVANGSGVTKVKGRPTWAQRQQSARLQATALGASALAVNTTMDPLGIPDYFGSIPNYANSPLPVSVSIIGDGMGALATATFDALSGQITGFTVVDGGSGYTAPNTSVSVIGGGGGGGQGTVTVENGVITNVAVTNGGVGYTAGLVLVAITDTTTGAPTAPASATATVGPGGVISGIALTSGGSGYVAPVVKITNVLPAGAPTVEATANTTVNDGVITAIAKDLLNLGTGYGSAPGIRKFVDTLPGLGSGAANDLGQYIPVAAADTGAPNKASWVTTDPRTGKTYPAADYYWIGVVQYKEQLHADLPATTLRGYVQIDTGATLTGTSSVAGSKAIPLTYPDTTPITYDPDGAGALPAVQVKAVDKPQYLGPTIVAQKDTPVRVKFSDLLPSKTTGGDLFLPVDTSIMGAGDGPDANPAGGMYKYSTNRATLHLHGGTTP